MKATDFKPGEIVWRRVGDRWARVRVVRVSSSGERVIVTHEPGGTRKHYVAPSKLRRVETRLGASS